jgi:hypothetical protein
LGETGFEPVVCLHKTDLQSAALNRSAILLEIKYLTCVIDNCLLMNSKILISKRAAFTKKNTNIYLSIGHTTKIIIKYYSYAYKLYAIQVTGLEPALIKTNQILSLARLPIPPYL